MTRADLTVVPPFYQGYVNHVKDFDVIDALENSSSYTLAIVRNIPEAQGEYRYADGKWSIKELLCHMGDAERVFAYRALRFARHDKTALEGFDENAYAPQANAHSRSIASIANELERLRSTTVDFFKSLTPEMLQRTGIANKAEISVLHYGYIIAGHESHHRTVLLDRYLKT